jgi:hypothetical protein
MAPALQATLSCSLTIGVPLWFAVRELLLLGRDGHGPWRRRGKPRPPPIAPTRFGERPARPLPECLIPKPLPIGDRTEAVRERELA